MKILLWHKRFMLAASCYAVPLTLLCLFAPPSLALWFHMLMSSLTTLTVLALWLAPKTK